jgi:hypothetical protein
MRSTGDRPAYARLRLSELRGVPLLDCSRITGRSCLQKIAEKALVTRKVICAAVATCG